MSSGEKEGKGETEGERMKQGRYRREPGRDIESVKVTSRVNSLTE